MCTLSRRRSFADGDAVAIARRELLRTAAAQHVEVIAYVFMPDHFHGLFEGLTETANVKHYCDIFRQQAGYHYKASYRRKLWQEGFFDHILRSEEETFDVVCYILANPVRAGLAPDAMSYPYSGSSRYSLEEIVTTVTWRPEVALRR